MKIYSVFFCNALLCCLMLCSCGIFEKKKVVSEFEKARQNEPALILKAKLNFIEKKKPQKNIRRKLAAVVDALKEDISLSHYNYNQLEYLHRSLSDLLQTTLKSQGYYDAKVHSQIAKTIKKNKKNITVKIIYDIDLGLQYKIGKITISKVDSSNHSLDVLDISLLKIKEGDPAIALNIMAEEENITSQIENLYCVRFANAKHQVLLDRLNKSIYVDYKVEIGPNAAIGDVEFLGLKGVKPDYPRKIIDLNKGECFRRSKMKDAQSQLQNTGLFSSVTPEIAETPNADGLVPISFALKERKTKTVKVGLNYGTDSGFGISSGWVHRNVFGRGERIAFNAGIGKKEQSGDVEYSIPFFKHKDQTLKTKGELKNEKTKAYTSKIVSTSSIIERKIQDHITIGAGGQYSFYNIVEDYKNKKTSLISTPIFITRDTRDDKFNPRYGARSKLNITPFLNYNQTKYSFAKIIITNSNYLNFGDQYTLDPIIAFKAAIGNIFGTEVENIVPNERFYIGGATTVRGYAEQSVGRLNHSQKPIGGRMLITGASELRLRLNDSLGFVTFFDIGTNHGLEFQKLNKRFLSGAGIGIRYFTGFVPIRFDVSIPLNRRKGLDNAYQFHFGIGQSF